MCEILVSAGVKMNERVISACACSYSSGSPAQSLFQFVNSDFPAGFHCQTQESPMIRGSKLHSDTEENHELLLRCSGWLEAASLRNMGRET